MRKSTECHVFRTCSQSPAPCTPWALHGPGTLGECAAGHAGLGLQRCRDEEEGAVLEAAFLFGLCCEKSYLESLVCDRHDLPHRIWIGCLAASGRRASMSRLKPRDFGG